MNENWVIHVLPYFNACLIRQNPMSSKEKQANFSRRCPKERVSCQRLIPIGVCRELPFVRRTATKGSAYANFTPMTVALSNARIRCK